MYSIVLQTIFHEYKKINIQVWKGRIFNLFKKTKGLVGYVHARYFEVKHLITPNNVGTTYLFPWLGSSFD